MLWPSSSFFLLSPSFLLGFFLLFFLLGHDFRFLGVHGGVGREVCEENERGRLCFLYAQNDFSSLSFLILAEHMLCGGVCVSFFFSFITLASRFNFAFNAYQVLSWWYSKNHVQRMVFMSCFAKSQQCWLKISFLSLPFLLWTVKSMARHVQLYFFSFSKTTSTYMYIYIYTYTYTYTSIIITCSICLLSSWFGRDFCLKKGVWLALFYFYQVLL